MIKKNSEKKCPPKNFTKISKDPDNAGNGDWRYNTNRTRSCELKQHSHKFTEKNVGKILLLKIFKMADK